MRHVSKPELIKLFSLANANYRDLDAGDLDPQQFIALCWAKAVNESILREPVLQFPVRILVTPDED